MPERDANLSSPGEIDTLGYTGDMPDEITGNEAWLEPDARQNYYLMTAGPERNPLEYTVTFPAMLEAMHRHHPPYKVEYLMDLGCSTGEFTQQYANHFPDLQHLVGIDVDETAVSIAQAEAYARAPQHPDVEEHYGVWGTDVRWSPAERIETPQHFPEEYYDVIASKLALDLVPLDEITTHRISASLRPGGILVIAIHHPEHSAKYAQFPNGYIPYDIAAPYKASIGADPNMIVTRQHRPQRHYEQAFGRYGVNIVEATSLYVPETMAKEYEMDPSVTETPRRLVMTFQKVV